MKNTHKNITILDPESWDLKYQQKRRQWYYKLSPDFFNHPLIFPVSCEAKLLFLDIIRQSQRVDKPQLSYCLDSAKGLLRGDLDLIKRALRELKDNNIIDLESNVRCQLIEENRIEENRIEANRNFDKQNAPVSFDFEAPYKNYPLKKGKSKGMEKIKRQIKTAEQYGNFCKAVENYAFVCEKEKTEPRFIKHFSTFVGEWEDFVVIEEGMIIKTEEEKLADLMEDFAAGKFDV